jgi:Mg2+/Co2+ transporter CorB
MTAWMLTLAGLVLASAAWLRAAGTAISRVPRADALRDESGDVAGAGIVAEMLDNRDVIGPAVSVVASALLVVGAVLATAFLARGASIGGALLVASAVGLVSFLVADLVPRRLGRLNPAGLAYRSHGILHLASRLGGWANDLLPDVDNGIEGR